MSMIVKVETETGLRYEDFHPKCKCIHSKLGMQDVAFIQCFDTSTGEIKRYWGKFNINLPEASILSILKNGSKWPRLGQADPEYPEDEG